MLLVLEEVVTVKTIYMYVICTYIYINAYHPGILIADSYNGENFILK